ncbi:MAG: guaB, partial [Acidimicrobiaceae bacterium]
IEKLPLVDTDGFLRGLITVKDIQKRQEFPNATRDGGGRLRCAAAVGVGADLEDRVEALHAMDVDAIAIDTAHGHSAGVIKAIERIKSSWPDLAVVAGNVVTEEGVEALAAAGADAVKVGVGAGSICTTRVVSGAGMPQLSAIWFTTRRARQLGVPVIADGGITYSGDVVKALAAGAETVMLGSLLAGTDESPGEMELFEGRRYKSYRGMGSMGAMQGLGADRYASGQEAGAGGDRRPCRLRRHAWRCRVSVGGWSAQRHGVRRCRNARCVAQRGAVHEGHRGRARGEPPARCDDHQGSAELPAHVSVVICQALPMRRSIDDYPFAESDLPEGTDDAQRLAWAVAISDDYDDLEPRVVLTVEEVGRPGEGLIAHLTPEHARRLRIALRDALREIGAEPGS